MRFALVQFILLSGLALGMIACKKENTHSHPQSSEQQVKNRRTQPTPDQGKIEKETPAEEVPEKQIVPIRPVFQSQTPIFDLPNYLEAPDYMKIESPDGVIGAIEGPDATTTDGQLVVDQTKEELSIDELNTFIREYRSPLKSKLFEYLRSDQSRFTAVRVDRVINEIIAINRETIGKVMELMLIVKVYQNEEPIKGNINKLRELHIQLQENMKTFWHENQGVYDFSYGFFGFGYSMTPNQVFAKNSQLKFALENFGKRMDKLIAQGFSYKKERPPRGWSRSNSSPLSREIIEFSQYRGMGANLLEFSPFAYMDTRTAGVMRELQILMNPIFPFDSGFNIDDSLDYLKAKDHIELAQGLSPAFYLSERITFQLHDTEKAIIFEMKLPREKWNRDEKTVERDAPDEEKWIWRPFKDRDISTDQAVQVWNYFVNFYNKPRFHAFNLTEESLQFWLPDEVLIHFFHKETEKVDGTFDYKSGLLRMKLSLMDFIDGDISSLLVPKDFDPNSVSEDDEI